MQIEISFNVQESKSVISYEQAQAQKEIFDLSSEYRGKQETARYLMGNRRGAWGRTTQADEKRSNQLANLKIKIGIKQRAFNEKYI